MFQFCYYYFKYFELNLEFNAGGYNINILANTVGETPLVWSLEVNCQISKLVN